MVGTQKAITNHEMARAAAMKLLKEAEQYYVIFMLGMWAQKLLARFVSGS